MPLAKCARCAMMYNKVKAPVCERCRPEEDDDYDLIRDTLMQCPDMTVQNLVDKCGVTEACVLRMVDAGLVADVSLADGYFCGRCGAPAISASKKLCQTCLGKMNQQVKKTMENLDNADTPGAPKKGVARMVNRAAGNDIRR